MGFARWHPEVKAAFARADEADLALSQMARRGVNPRSPEFVAAQRERNRLLDEAHLTEKDIERKIMMGRAT